MIETDAFFESNREYLSRMEGSIKSEMAATFEAEKREANNESNTFSS